MQINKNSANNIDWPGTREYVYNIQKDIYTASKHQNFGLVHNIQQTLLDSIQAKRLAVKRVCKDSTGKNTAGIDNVKSLTPGQRLKLAESLKLDDKASPVRRVWIPKPGTTDKRPLGIPTIIDRAKQALALIALEPEWEAQFEPHSYGFRPGRSCHDAIKYIKTALLHSQKYIYDADIEKCFDRISHTYLLSKLSQPIGSLIHTQVNAWLKCGILETGTPFVPSEIGTPQGGVISPLLANIALHGLEYNIKTSLQGLPGGKKIIDQTKVIRYADDFIIMSPNKQIHDRAIQATEIFLEKIGLNIKAAKTRNIHSLDKTLCPDGDNSFKFLGYLIAQRKIGKRSTQLTGGGRKISWKVVILPHPEKERIHFDKIRSVIRKCTKPAEVIRQLNPVIRGWANYFRRSDAATYKKVAWYNKRLYIIVSNWQKRQYHTRKKLATLWKTVGNNTWRFYSKSKVKSGKKLVEKEFVLLNYGCVSWSVNTYTAIKADSSPYDGNDTYWVQRTNSASRKAETLIRKQKGICPLCNRKLSALDLVQVDHKTPRALGGTEESANLQAVHKECHAIKTKVDRKNMGELR
uniref:Reverse transcriptase domain-containing protein n=1 Tax=Borodinellopsis insignis TaxID=3229915 RepID=A0AB39A642_9CHLO